MSSSFTLTDGLNTITLYPEYSSTLGAHMDRSMHRMQTQALKSYLWAVYPEYELGVNDISESDATTINDWWQRRVSLFFTHTVDGTIRVSQSCKLSGDSLPLPRIHDYDITKRHGTLKLMMLDPITYPNKYSLFCGCESVAGSAGLFNPSYDYNPRSEYIFMPFSDSLGPMTLDTSYTMAGSYSFRVPVTTGGGWQMIYPSRFDHVLNIQWNEYLKTTSGWITSGATLTGSNYQLSLDIGGGTRGTNTIESNVIVNSVNVIDHYQMPLPLPLNQWATWNLRVDLPGKRWNLLLNNVLCASGSMFEVPIVTAGYRSRFFTALYVPYNTASHAVFIDGFYQTDRWNDSLFNIRTLWSYPL